MRFFAATVLAGALVGPLPTLADPSEDAEAVLLRMKARELVTLRTVDGETVTGRLLGVQAGRATISPTNRSGYPLPEPDRVVPAMGVSQIEIRQSRLGPWARKGAAYGLATGLALGVVGALTVGTLDFDTGTVSGGAYTFFFATTGLVTGAVTGAGLGAAFPAWTTRYSTLLGDATEGSPDASESAGTVLRRAGGSQLIRLGTSEGETVTGRLRSVRGEVVTVAPTHSSGHPTVIPLIEVSRIEMRESRAREWASNGLGLGVVAGFLLGVAGAAAAESEFGDGFALSILLGSSAVGGLTGAAVGGGLGAALPAWRLRYPGPEPDA